MDIAMATSMGISMGINNMLSANHRIARNTIYMYIRQITNMVVGLYTSRLVLEILGVSDFGLFAVVGGVLAIFTFISSSLATSTSRFFNIEMGRTGGDVNASFCINIVLHVALAVVIFVLAESIGLWYVCNRLNVDSGKIVDAIFVYQVSIATACLGIVNTPYRSLLTAYEWFGFLAAIDVVNSFVRLGCVVLLGFYHGPYALRLYSIIFAITIANTFVVFHIVAYRKWRETIRFRFIRSWQCYKAVLTFGSWNVLATLAYTARSSGSDLLLNSFFGTTMNGAFAISKTINNTLMTFTGSFDGASAPQIIQAYAAGDKPRYTYLCNKLGRINLLMFELIAFPLLIQLDYVLHLWLGIVPQNTLIFSTLYIVIAGISMSCGGIYNLMNATSDIKWFKINCSILFVVCLPISYVMFAYGYPAYTILALFIIADIAQRAVQLWLLKRIVGFDAWLYAKEAYTRPLLIALLLTGIILICHYLPIVGGIAKMTSIATCVIITIFLILFVGLHADERKALRSFIKNKI